MLNVPVNNIISEIAEVVKLPGNLATTQITEVLKLPGNLARTQIHARNCYYRQII